MIMGSWLNEYKTKNENKWSQYKTKQKLGRHCETTHKIRYNKEYGGNK